MSVLNNAAGLGEETLVANLRDFILQGARINAVGEPQSLLERYDADAPIIWTVWNGEEVTGTPQDFLDILTHLKVLEPEPDPDPVVETVAVAMGDPVLGRGSMLVTGRDGQRSRLSYEFRLSEEGWRITAMRGHFLDDGHMALRNV